MLRYDEPPRSGFVQLVSLLPPHRPYIPILKFPIAQENLSAVSAWSTHCVKPSALAKTASLAVYPDTNPRYISYNPHWQYISISVRSQWPSVPHLCSLQPIFMFAFVKFPPSYGRASKTKLNGVSVARRKRVNPPAVTTSRKRASPAWLPKASPTSCDSEAGVQTCVEAE